ncbi:MAG TPA: patatin [Algoriphagus sp.]|jgi:NTE family protein|uniref:patatin-like phospholipase family protein n=1 Tax=unclassified Algoriphagus TaxID=2641541 RepID=UPI000C4F2AA4|nr:MULTISPECIES: patatin-like phospholipase family protein [unclassified Algoriphagus]MAL15538.1 patatin [Algoriphagus sp.]HAD52347.1 patatin [Algoriphagus sp.]HAS57598.1 patatin [Algoriphagus sp.]HAZ26296.1 patatin [Algoriphagus sp.]HCD89609.1 patatin [Algoriphagus sp.]|tara:strand:+ start:2126 stop:2929 length:804 start_codon:yes stop_codon:yes gene_type:complete
MKSELKIGVALSGGGVRGISHLGVLKGLNEAGIYPTQISGTSAGAIAGAMYCQGYQPEEVLKIIVETNYFKFLRPAISWTGILKMSSIESLFKIYMAHNDFGQLKIPLTVAATDIKRGKAVYFSEGELIRPVMASSCIPGMFEPIEIENKYLVDGGVLNNLPVEPLDGICDYVIGVNCNHLPEESNITNMKKLIERSVIMAMNYNVYSRKAKCDYFIEAPGLGKFGVFDIKKASQLFQAGYTQTMKYIEENPSILELSKPNKSTLSA